MQTSDEWLVFLLCQILDVDFIGDSAGHKESKVYKSWLVESLGSGSILPKFTVKYSIPSIYLTQNEQNCGSEFKLNFC